jgi:cellulose synthase/poly-beta-1,6-N-acetylglucosamine synthase-like glycosyltransferase
MILVLAFGFARLEELPSPKDPTLNFISVIIPVRDESAVPDFSEIRYPRDKWELIVVDDSDQPVQLSIPTLRSPSPGKKAAITAGIASAKGNIIVTTDADCTVNPMWLNEINNGFQNEKTKMLVGGVRISEDETFFSRLQALEFVSVAVTAAATLGLGSPTMCNGANLAYRKQSFIEVNGYQGNENISSGDDIFLMNKFPKESIHYLYSKDAIVTSSPHHLVTSFISQRLRWAGKWKSNTSGSTQIFAVVVWLFHVSFIAMAFIVPWKLFIQLFAAKIFVECILLIPASNFFGVKWRWIPFIVLQLIYSVYVISIGFMSQILLPKWKGRRVATKV